jgi:hypothetical protein
MSHTEFARVKSKSDGNQISSSPKVSLMYTEAPMEAFAEIKRAIFRNRSTGIPYRT